jgi:hypothetical protein
VTTSAATDRILVLDDEDYVKARLASVLGPVVDWCPNVGELQRRIDKGETWSAAFIDFFLGPGQPCGLNAMMLLSRAHPSTQLVSLTSFGDAGGRMLFIATADHWYNAVFVDKANLEPDIIRRAVDPHDNPTAPRLRQQLRQSFLVDALFTKPSWLPIWQAWPRFDGSHPAIIAALGPTYTPSILRAFTAGAISAVQDFEAAFPTPDPIFARRRRNQLPEHRRGNQALAVPLARFASENRIFFTAPEIDHVISDIKPDAHRH